MIGVKAISAGFDHNVVIQSGILDPIIFTQPTDQYAMAGSNVTFSAMGAGVAGVQYQWQFNGVNITGATNSTLTLTNVVLTNQGNYDVVVTVDGVYITSDMATLTLVAVPQIGLIAPTNTGVTWINGVETLNVLVTNDSDNYPMQYDWYFNGTNLGDNLNFYTFPSVSPTNDGTYTVGITNVTLGTNVTWNIRLALPGMVEAWGTNGSGECNRPGTLTNVAAIAAGEYQSIAVTGSGAVVQWGQYSDGTNLYSVTNTSVATQPPASGVVAVAAGLGQGLALTTSNTVTAWGLNNAPGATIPSGLILTNVTAIACGWQFDLALLGNGTVKAWGNNTYGQTNIPSYVTNVIAISAGATHALALQANGTVVYWGWSQGPTNPPVSLLSTNTVAIASGADHDMALLANGTVVAWGTNNFGQTNVPAGLSNVMAVAAGGYHSVALLNNGTLVEWGDNSSGQATVPGAQQIVNYSLVYNPQGPPTFLTFTYPPIIVKLIAAGGDHTMAAIFSPLVQYPINVTKDLLLIYNATNISYSSNVCAYYMAYRPMVRNANRLGISCATNEGMTWNSYTSTFVAPIVNWLSNNPTLRPQYVILFQDLPSRFTNAGGTGTASIQYDMNAGYNSSFSTTNYLPTWTPFVTSINMNGTGGTNDCIQYINKLASFGSNYSPGQLFISPSAARYANTNWYFDDAQGDNPDYPLGFEASEGVESNGVPTNDVTYTPFTDNTHITKGTNVAGYFTWGKNGNLPAGYATNGTISFFGVSTWYLIATAESFNGQRVPAVSQGNFLSWYASNAFGGANYSNTPVGAVTHVDEPTLPGVENTFTYYGLWAAGTSFGICAWDALHSNANNDFLECAVVGDPFVIE
jgi:hypothetical protein